MNELSIRHLLRDHRQAEKFLAELDSLLERLNTDQRWSREASETFDRVSRFLAEDLEGHISKEEEALFPTLEDFLPRDVGPLAVLRGEHADLRANFRALQKAAQSISRRGSRPQSLYKFSSLARATAQLLRDHMYKEERVLFPMVARFLTPHQDVRILDRMESLKRGEASRPPSEETPEQPARGRSRKATHHSR